MRAAAETLPFARRFDLVVSYVTLVDIVDFRAAIAECGRVLAPGGRFVVANLDFVTASFGLAARCAAAPPLPQLDRYADELSQTYEWAGMRIVNWHRPLSALHGAFLAPGLQLRDFLEPVPKTSRCATIRTSRTGSASRCST